MTTQLHDTGEEFVVDYIFTDGATRPANVSIGLFNDSTDTLSDSSDYDGSSGDITTEPTGGAYAEQTASFGTSDFTNSDNGGDWETVIADQTFDTSNSSQSVDSYFVTIHFQADDTSDTGTVTHLFWTGDLDQTYDLSGIDSFTISGAGLSVT